MLTFKPTPLAAEMAYTAYDEQGAVCGQIVFALRGYTVEILSLQVADGDPETQEGLLRSALHYAGNRNAYVAVYLADTATDVAKNLGFAMQGDRLYGEIPELLQGRCCKEKD